MAHDIQVIDGVASVFGAAGSERHWHRLETPLEDVTSLDEAMRIARMNYKVEVVPSYQRIVLAGDDEFYRKVDGTNYTIRTDTNAVLGTVGDRYTPIQNMDAFRVLEPLLDRGYATLDSGATLADGEDVFMNVLFNHKNSDVTEFREKHGLKSYGLINNNHSGKRKLGLQTTDIRTVCRNTLRMAQFNAKKGIDDNIQIRHTKTGVESTIAAAKELWGRIDANATKAAKDYQLMMDTMLTDEQFERLVLDVVLPLPKKSETKRGETMLDKLIMRRGSVTDLWMTGKGHDGTPSAWFAYQGACEAIDHHPDIFKSRSDEGRTASVLIGTYNDLKAKLADSLVRFAVTSK